MQIGNQRSTIQAVPCYNSSRGQGDRNKVEGAPGLAWRLQRKIISQLSIKAFHSKVIEHSSRFVSFKNKVPNHLWKE